MDKGLYPSTEKNSFACLTQHKRLKLQDAPAISLSKGAKWERNEGKGLESDLPQQTSAKFPPPQLLSMQTNLLRDIAMRESKASSHSLAWQKPDWGKGKPHANYKTIILPPTTMAHFYSPSKNSTLFRKSHHIVWTKNNVLFPRKTSSSASLTQDLLYPGKCGWSPLILLLGPEQQWRHMLSSESWNCPADQEPRTEAASKPKPLPQGSFTPLASEGSKGLVKFDSTPQPSCQLPNCSQAGGNPKLTPIGPRTVCVYIWCSSNPAYFELNDCRLALEKPLHHPSEHGHLPGAITVLGPGIP